MAGKRDIYQSAVSGSAAAMSLTARQAEVLELAGRGLSGKQIAHHLGISVRTVEDHFSAMRQRTGTHSQIELIACATAAGLVRPAVPFPESVISGTAAMPTGSAGETRPGNQSRNGVPPDPLRDGMRDDQLEHPCRLRQQRPDRLRAGQHPRPGPPGPARRPGGRALPRGRGGDRQHTRRPAKTTGHAGRATAR